MHLERHGPIVYCRYQYDAVKCDSLIAFAAQLCTAKLLCSVNLG